MGKRKLEMELIRELKPRISTFKRRKQGLFRKLEEFTTLCDVKACAIIYGPEEGKGSAEPAIWPENVDDVRLLIDGYKSKTKGSEKKKNEDRKEKYPTDLGFINSYTEGQLRDLAAILCAKIEFAKSRIDIMKKRKEDLFWNSMGFDGVLPENEFCSLEPVGVTESDPVNLNNWMTMPSLLEENESGAQFGGQVFCDSIRGVDTMRDQFYAMPPVAQQAYTMMPEMVLDNAPAPVAQQAYTTMPETYAMMPEMVLDTPASFAQQAYARMPEIVLDMPAQVARQACAMMPGIASGTVGEQAYAMMPGMVLGTPVSFARQAYAMMPEMGINYATSTALFG